MRSFLFSIPSSILIAIIISLCTFSPDTIFAQSNNKIHTVVIDPGHGGKDPGAVGSFSKEKDVVLAISLKLAEYIRASFPDVKVILTRETDVFPALHERAEIANKNHADLFISVHANANENKTIFGTETYVMGLHKSDENFEVAKLENSVILMEEDYSEKYEGFDPKSAESYIIFSLMQDIHLKQSLNFAFFVQNEFKNRAVRKDRGVRQAGFLVLWRTSMPSVLVETGYISNKDEEVYLNSETGQDYLASAIFRAFREYKHSVESVIHETPLVQRNSIDSSVTHKPRSEIYFKIQVFSSKQKVELKPENFSNFTEIEEFIVGKYFKYAVGHEQEYASIVNYLTQVRQVYKDAFVIAVKNGEIIPVSEAVHHD